MPDPHDPRPAPGGRGATVLWVAAVLLALGATAVMVLSDDVQILRLGLVGALWSALVAALAVTKLRQRLSEKSDREADLKRIYELELEREIAARREFEAEAENDARRRAAEESSDDLARLRSELANLRSTLEQIVGGDVLVERVALRAESTRVRSWGEQGGNSHVIQSADARGRPLPAGRSDNGMYVEYGHSDYAQNGHAEFASRSDDGGYRADHGQAARTYQHGIDKSGQAARADRQGPNGAARTAQNGRRPAPSGQQSGQDEPAAARTDLIARMNGDQPTPHAQQTSGHPRRPAPGHPAPARPGSGNGDPMRDSARPAVIRRDQSAANAARRARADAPAAEHTSGHTGEWPVATGNLSEPTASTRTAHEPATPEPAAQEPAEAKHAGRSGPVPGAHAEGTSVTELLAAFGGKGTSTGRRRRQE